MRWVGSKEWFLQQIPSQQQKNLRLLDFICTWILFEWIKSATNVAFLAQHFVKLLQMSCKLLDNMPLIPPNVLCFMLDGYFAIGFSFSHILLVIANKRTWCSFFLQVIRLGPLNAFFQRPIFSFSTKYTKSELLSFNVHIDFGWPRMKKTALSMLFMRDSFVPLFFPLFIAMDCSSFADLHWYFRPLILCLTFSEISAIKPFWTLVNKMSSSFFLRAYRVA